MCKISLTFFFIILTFNTFSQTPIEYTYDNAGNRTQRYVVTLKEGLEEQLDAPISLGETLYPNPTLGILSLNMGEDLRELSDKKIEVYTLDGKLLYKTTKVYEGLNINLSNQPAGMYIIKVYAKDYSSTWKVIKE